MKKIMTIAAMLLIGATAFAQVHVGAGYTQGQNSLKINDEVNKTATNGFYAGASYNIPIIAGFGIAPGVYYNFLTSNDASSFYGLASSDVTLKEHYINVPVLANYAIDLGPAKVFVYGGPTASFGLSSKTDLKGSVTIPIIDKTASTNETVDNYAEDSNYSRTDVKLGVGGGVQFGPIQVNVGYDWGMFNRYTGDSDNVSRKSNLLHAGVAYIF